MRFKFRPRTVLSLLRNAWVLSGATMVAAAFFLSPVMAATIPGPGSIDTRATGKAAPANSETAASGSSDSLFTALAKPDNPNRGRKTRTPTPTNVPPTATAVPTSTIVPTLAPTIVPATSTPAPTLAATPSPTAAAGPVASAELRAAYSFDEGSGTTVADSSGKGNTGTISGASWTGQGRFGGALSFDGRGSRVTVSNTGSLDLGADLTLEAWVYPTALGGWRSVLIKEQPGDLTYGLYADTEGGMPRGYVYIGGEIDVRGASGIPINSWTHLAVTHDGALLNLYVNGALVSSRPAAGTTPASAGPLEIGGNALWGEHFAGSIDEVRVYSRALSQAEIQLDMQASVSGSPPPMETAVPTPTTGMPTATPIATATPVPSPTAPPVGDPPPSSGDPDWPQLGHDAQKTNASPQQVNGPYRFYWRWTEVPIASRVQPVVSNGRLFVGGLNGTFYALDAAYDARGGAPRILWQRDLSSPVRSGAGVDGDVVVVGTHHGAILGLDAATGGYRWSVGTGGAILAAPLIAGGVAYIGSADGTFYAIRTSDGAVVWKQAVGVPILGSAALSTDGSRLFFVAENVKAYALSTASGTLLWQTQLQGQSGSDRWPVVIDSLVVFRTMTLLHAREILIEGDRVMDGAGAVMSDWSNDWGIVSPQILSYLDSNPINQTFFALDTSTGRSRGTAPVLFTFGDNDPPSPPAALNGALYLPYRARHGIQTDSSVAVHISTKYDAELGRMDPSSLDITGLRAQDSFNYQFRLTSDEPGVVTIAGDMVLVDNWERLGGIHLNSGSMEGVAQVAVESSCWAHLASNDALPPFYDDCPFPGPRRGEGNARSGAVAASGRVFWHAGRSGLAAIGPSTGSSSTAVLSAAAARPTLGPMPAPVAVSDQALAAYVWAEPSQPTLVPQDLQARLEKEVRAVVSTNEHLMPFYLERGLHASGTWPPDVSNAAEPASVGNAGAYWYDPGELIYSLSVTYPYLTAPLQSQLKDYLQAEMGRFAPLSNLPWPTDSWLKQGAAREPYLVPIRSSLGTWPPPGTPIQTIYALWAYAHYTGDWTYVSARWGQIQSLFNAKKGQINSYAEIAGPIGYARIAKQLGYPAEAAAGEAAAVSAMRNGLDFAQWNSRANVLYPPFVEDNGANAGYKGQVFLGLVPEVGNYLRQTNLAAVDYLLDDLTGYPNGVYLWYATRLGQQAESTENSFDAPEIGWSAFLAQAYVKQAGQQQLRYWLDRPWGLGDPWYLQKVVATIQAGQ